jgi:hypothetical protein
MNAKVEALFGGHVAGGRGRVVPWGACGVCEGTCHGPAGCCNQHGAPGSYEALFGLIASRLL